MCDNSSSEFDANQNKINAAALPKYKRFLLWLNRHPDSSLTFADNLIFSALTRKPASQRGLAKLTGLCRRKAIPDSIEKLTELGLCEYTDGKYSALEPQDFANWVTWTNPEAKRWQDKITYFRIYQLSASSKLSTRQNVLFCKILNYPGKLPAYYSTCLGLSRRTVYDQLKSLRRDGLMAMSGCHVPEAVPDQWSSKPVVAGVVAPAIHKFLLKIEEPWLEPEVVLEKIEAVSETLASRCGHTQSYLRRYWTDTCTALHYSNRILAFVAESHKIAAHVIAKGKTRKYLKTTTALVVKQMEQVPLDRTIYWNFEPDLLLKSL